MIYAYKAGSNSAKQLGKALDKKIIKTENSKFKGNPNKIVINWGASVVSEEVEKCNVINNPLAVKTASNKLSFFNEVQDKVFIPEFTTDIGIAKDWVGAGATIVAREILTGHSGAGIHILNNSTEFNNFHHSNVRMYVKYIPKAEEYRVHVVRGKVIDVRRKALKTDWPKSLVNWKVRNLAGGFIYAKEGFNTPEMVLDQALLAVKVCGLDFGAVDVIWNNFREMAYVLEINTAPGLEGSTIDNYAKAFKQFYVDIEDEYLEEDDEEQPHDEYGQGLLEEPHKAKVPMPMYFLEDEAL